MAHEAFERPSKPVRNVVWSRNCLFRTWPRVPSQWPLPPASSATTIVLVPRLAVVKRNVQNDCLYHIVPLWMEGPPDRSRASHFFRGSICALGLGASYDSPQIPHDRPFTSVRFIIYVGTRLTKVTQSRRSGLIFRPIIPGSDRSVLPFHRPVIKLWAGPLAHMGLAIAVQSPIDSFVDFCPN